MSNLVVRAITGALFVFVVLGSIFWEERVALVVLGGFMALGLIEFLMLFKTSDKVSIRWEIGFTYGILLFGLFVSAMFEQIPQILLLLSFPITFLLMLTELWRKKDNPILNIGTQLLGAFYVVVPFFMMAMIHHYNTSLEEIGLLSGIPLLAGMFILVWTNDTFAYLTGRLIGRTKLFERVSPKKTWEGTIGGIVFTIGAGYAISLYSPQFDLLFWMVSGGLIACCAILGDLLESVFKRSLNIKDSGNILPGHGGILDRFDAALFAAPFFVCWTYFNIYFM